MSIPVKVTDRILEIDLLRVDPLVCANQYSFAVTFDSEWESITQRYARIRFGGQYYEIPFTGTTFTANMPSGVPMVEIGIYGGTIATSVKRVPLLASVLDVQGTMVEFDSELFDQWDAAVTALLTDDALDAESAHPVANSVITPMLQDAVYKTTGGTQTIENDVVITGKTDALALRTLASYNSSVNSGRFLRIYRFVRPSGAKWALTLRVDRRDRAGYNIVQIQAAYANGEVTGGAISVMTSYGNREAYSLTYDSANDRFDVYFKASGTSVRPINVVLVDGYSDDGVIQPAMVGSIASSTSRAGTLIAEADPKAMNYNLDMIQSKSSTATPWHRIAYASAPSTIGLGIGAFFMVSTSSPILSEMFGMFHVGQRTTTPTPGLTMKWFGGYGIDPDDWAVVQRDGLVEIWYHQSAQYAVPETVFLTGWRSNNYYVPWTVDDADSQELAAALPSGEGIFSAASTISVLTPPASLAMMSPSALQGMALDAPDAQTDGDGDRNQEEQR
jgi:hypothetical protein